MGLLTDKIKAFDQYRDDIDIVFIGTSRTFRQVNAPMIESLMQEKGCGSYTVFNMGIPNLTYVEMRYVLDHIYAKPVPRLKMVILDEPMPAVRPELERLWADRIRYFSDVSGTVVRLQDILSDQHTPLKKMARVGIAVLGFLYEQSNVGHLSRGVFPQLYAHYTETDPESQNMPDDWKATRGYFSLEEQGHVNEAVQKRHDVFLKNLPAFSERLEAQKQHEPDVSVLSPVRLVLFEDVLTRIRDHGQIAGLYLPPLPDNVSGNLALERAVARLSPEILLLYYNDPARYRVFWDARLWFDDAHLNDEGSRMLSALMAENMCSVTKKWESSSHAVR